MSLISVKSGFLPLSHTCRTLLTKKVQIPQIAQVALISSRSKLSPEEKAERALIKPWPYEKKGYRWYNIHTDFTTKRWNDNSKVIVVEGPIASGKTALAKQLAEELEFKYFPMYTMEMEYTNDYGYDNRKLDPLLTPKMRSMDEQAYLKDPNSERGIWMNFLFYAGRFNQYMEALAHLFNTGQGVVLDRSIFGQRCFVEAAYACGWMTQTDRNAYYTYKSQTYEYVLQPHVVIYLDVSVDNTIKNMEKRGRGEEKVLAPKFAEHMELDYKQNVLKSIQDHSELFIYDWTDGGDVDMVVDDLERIDFDSFEKDPQNPKMMDWRLDQEEDYCVLRHRYTMLRTDMAMEFNQQVLFDCPATTFGGEDFRTWDRVYYEGPGNQHPAGWNPKEGDNPWLRMFDPRFTGLFKNNNKKQNA